nr:MULTISPECIES: FAD-dependent oxidoreductase [Pseudonocardiaceae]
MGVQFTEVVVIGAGQAGLSASYHLRRNGIEHVVLDRNDGPGGAWQHRWPGLRLESVHGIHPLPGMPLPPSTPGRPAAEAVPEYFGAYEAAFELPVLRPVKVTAVRPDIDHLAVESSAGVFAARAVINATGTWETPFWPHYPGQHRFRGRQLHTADYRDPQEFSGQHVMVVGGGISAVEHLLEISEVTSVSWVTRRPPEFTGTEFTAEQGRAAVAEVARRVRDGEPPGSVVSATKIPATPAVRAALERGVLQRSPMFEQITEHGVRWPDGRTKRVDVLLWATGFRPSVAHLAPLHLREPGGGIRVDGTRAVAEPRLHLLGYGPSASTIGANRASRRAVTEIRKMLEKTAR